MAKKKPTVLGVIVLFDDQQGVCVPMGADPDCPGAIQAESGAVVVFPDRKAARHAIAVSAAAAKLAKLRGEPVNDDFLPPAVKCLRIVPVVRP